MSTCTQRTDHAFICHNSTRKKLLSACNLNTDDLILFSISDSRAMYVTYFPASSQISVVAVSPFQSKELSPQILERQFREASQALSLQPPMTSGGITFKVILLGIR